MNRRTILLGLGILAVGLVLASCAGPAGPEGSPGPQGPPGPAGPPGEPPAAADLSCTECHNDTTLIVSKDAQLNRLSLHGTGTAWEEGTRQACAGCHGTEGAKARIAAGLPPHDESVAAIVNPSPFDCRTCHDIHTSYTSADWALTGGEAAVKLEYTDGTFDGGAGNLCANCHQIRNAKPKVEGGNVAITTQRYGTHYGVEAQMLLGEGGLGVTGKPSTHYSTVKDSCVGCHMGEEYNHTYEPAVARCQACHTDAANFDINGVQTEVEAMLEELHTIFVGRKLLNPETDLWGIYDPATQKFANPTADAPLTVPEALANAMWNYKFVTYDGSNGAHNSAYAEALLQAALDALK